MTAPRRDVPGVVAVSAILACVWIRATVSVESFPGWSGDPAVLYGPVTGLTPFWGLVLDLLVMLATAVLLWRAKRGPGDTIFSRMAPWLVPMGGVGVLLHSGVFASIAPKWVGSLEDASLGSAWLAAASAGLAAWAIRDSLPLRKLWLAGVLSLVALLAVRGGSQYFIEHARTVESFRSQKAEVLASMGWTEGSAMAKAYERRLLQPEATGWFGLANVYGSLGAGFSLAFGAMWWRLRKDGVRGPGDCPASPWLVIAGLTCSLAMLGLSGAKGSIAAAIGVSGLIVVSTLIAARTTPRRQHLLGVSLGVACVVGPLLAVVARGAVGERLHELSLYFRWFYMQGTGRIVAEHSLAGVGPAGFKDAYLLAKNPLSPEEVSSPHSVLLDWVSTLGVAGWAWVGMLFASMIAAGRAVLSADGGSDAKTFENEQAPAWTDTELFKISFLPLAIATNAGAALERAMSAPEILLLRVLGLAVGLLIAWGVVRAARTHRMISTVAAAGTLAIVAHSQIELTGVTPGAILWLWALAGLSFGPGRSDASPNESSPAESAAFWSARCSALALLASTTILGATWLVRTHEWERALRQAADVFEPLQEFRVRAQALETGGGTVGSAMKASDTPESLARDLASILGTSVPATRPGIDAAIMRLRVATMDQSSQSLAQAAHVLHDRHFPTNQALSRLTLQRAESRFEGKAADAAALCRDATRLAQDTAVRINSAGAWGWAGTMFKTASELTRRAGGSEGGGTVADEYRRSALEAWQQAHRLAPHDLNFARQLVDLFDEAGDRASAGTWAQTCLEINERQRLDPLRQLSETERRRYERLANGP